MPLANMYNKKFTELSNVNDFAKWKKSYCSYRTSIHGK